MAFFSTFSVISRRLFAASAAILSASVTVTALVVSAATVTPAPEMRIQSWHSGRLLYSPGGIALRDCYHPYSQTLCQSCTCIKTRSLRYWVRVVCQRAGRHLRQQRGRTTSFTPAGMARSRIYYVITNANGFHPKIERC